MSERDLFGAVVVQAGDVPSERAGLAEWAEEAGISEVLRAPVEVLAGTVDPAIARHLRNFGNAVTVADVAVDERWTRSRVGSVVGLGALCALREAAHAYLLDAARCARARRAQKAAPLARPPPGAPALAGLVSRVRRARESITIDGPSPAGSEPRVIDFDPATFRFVVRIDGAIDV